MEISLTAALLGGVLTLLSPCSVMLLPAFFATAFAGAGTLLARTGAFYLGLVTTLVPLGLLAGSLGALLSEYRSVLVMVASGVIIVLGLIQLVGVPLPMLRRVADGDNSTSVYALGLVYGVAGTCSGPLLGAVLTIASVGGSALYGGLVLLFFALGMTLPLLLLAALWQRSTRLRTWLRPRELRVGRWRNAWMNVIGGALMIGIGVLLLVTDGTAGLPSIVSIELQADIETWALRFGNGISDGALAIFALAVLLATAWIIRARHNRRTAVHSTVEKEHR